MLKTPGLAGANGGVRCGANAGVRFGAGRCKIWG